MMLTGPANDSYVLIVATSTFFINTLHTLTTARFRKSSGIKYPIAYASQEQAEKDRQAYLFNCGGCFRSSLCQVYLGTCPS